MDWNLFWTAFGAIGGTVGALATSAAVIVALWQTKYSNKKKLKLAFYDDTRLLPSNGDLTLKREYVSITVTNIGNRNIKVCSWQVKLPGKKRAVVLLDTSPFGKMLAAPWPILLEPEEQATQYWDKAQFYAFVRHDFSRLSMEKQKMTFLVRDSTGKEYFIKSRKTWQDYYIEAEEYPDAHP